MEDHADVNIGDSIRSRDLLPTCETDFLGGLGEDFFDVVSASFLFRFKQLDVADAVDGCSAHVHPHDCLRLLVGLSERLKVQAAWTAASWIWYSTISRLSWSWKVAVMS